MVTLVTGGVRSGKSRHALELAAPYPTRAFVATAEPFDDDLRDRIRRHRETRGGGYFTVEAPIDLAAALGQLPDGTEVAVVDCLTVWLGNLIHRRRSSELSRDLQEYAEVGAFLAALAAAPCSLVVVSNEVGFGIVPANAQARSFVDLLGRLNQEVAARAERVVLMVSGIPLVVKGGREREETGRRPQGAMEDLP